MLKHLILYSLRRLRLKMFGTFLTVLGVAIGVANIVALISVSEIARNQAMKLLTELGANTIFVTPYFELEESPFQQSGVAATALPTSFANFFEGKPYVEKFTPILALPAYAGYRGRRVFTNVIGAYPEIFEIRPYKLEAGRFLDRDDIENSAYVSVLGNTVRVKLFPGENPIGEFIVVKGERYRVVGTLQEKGRLGFEDFDNRIFLPLERAQSAFKFPYIHVVGIKHPQSLNTEDVVEKIKEEVSAWLGVNKDDQDDFQAFSMKELTKTANETFHIFGVILLAVSSIALIVAGIGIMNVMLMSVVEQTREIGVRKAVGAKNSSILLQFLIEAFIQVFLGQLLGLIIGFTGVYILCLKVEWDFWISPKTVLLALLFSFVVGLAFAIIPAWRAAKMLPVNSLRYE